MKNIKKVELLSPAGSYEALKQAIHAGADAIYLGGKIFGARAFANNFDNEELQKAVEYAHLYGVKIYITVNTLIFEEEIKYFLKYIDFLVSIGVDALIMQDIGMIELVSNIYNIEIHSSTQMHNYSLSNLEHLKSLNIKRAVIARETSLEDIKAMSSIIETEVFIHGALCICYSGQCFFSSMEHGRSGNRGACAQVCRMKFNLMLDNDGELEQINRDGLFLLSPKDLGLFEDLTQIIEAGATSLKIEGRMKSPQYVGYVTKLYRKIIDNYNDNKNYQVSTDEHDSLNRLFNRGFTKGHIFNQKNERLMSIVRPNHKGVHIGEVINTNKDRITIQLIDTLHQGDGIKFKTVDKGFVCNKIYLNGNFVNKGEAGQTIQLDNFINLSDEDSVLLTSDSLLTKELSTYEEKKIPVKIHSELKVDFPINITITDDLNNVAEVSYGNVEKSINAPLSKENVQTNLSKLGNTAYIATDVSIEMDESIFVRKKELNEARRVAVEKLNNLRTSAKEYQKIDFQPEYTAPVPSALILSCLVRTKEQLDICIELGVEIIYVTNLNLYNEYKETHLNVYYVIPSLSKNEMDFSGERLLIRDTGGIKYAKNNIVNSDYMLNATNSTSIAALHKEGIKNVTLSIEIHDDDIPKITEGYKTSFGNYPNLEVLVYGRIQLMETKHCVIGKDGDCTACSAGDYYLQDVKFNNFPILTDDNCNNYIMSAKPIDYIEQIAVLKNSGVNSFRIEFLYETEDDVRRVIELFKWCNM